MRTILVVNVTMFAGIFLSVLTISTLVLASGNSIGYGYRLSSVDEDCNGNFLGELELIENTDTYGSDTEKLALYVSYETKDRIHVSITDADNERWEVPYDILPRKRPSFILEKSCVAKDLSSSHHLKFSYTEEPFGFSITRKSTGEVLFSTSNDLVFKDQFIQVSTQLPENAALYGLGESSRAKGFRLAKKDTYTLWDADIPSSNANINLYGSHPFYMDVRPGGSAHGVLLLNSNGMDIEYSGDLVTYKAIGGIIDFYFFAGPSPVSVVHQYTDLIGRPAPMPYWSFGFHQCRWGYKDVADLKTVVSGYKQKGIPLDVIWNDIDYMDDFKDFTVDPVNYAEPQMKAFLDQLHAEGKRYVLILDPGIKVEGGYSTFENALKSDIFIKENGKPYLAQVWPGPVHFPDFMNPKTHKFWAEEVSKFLEKIPADGLWIDMNEVSNFCSGTECSMPKDGTCPIKGVPVTECCLDCKISSNDRLEDPTYKINNFGIQRHIRNKTMTPSATHYNGVSEYNAHNLYGFYETIATHSALKSYQQKRPFILSRSTFVGSGKYAAHWTGDNAATWDDLKYSIPTMLNFGLFGIPMVGADICGFLKDTTEELCNRWIQLGAFYPFSRQHSNNGTIRQELYVWDSVTDAAKKALALRYKLLPYLYTLSYEAHEEGIPIARPLFFTFNDSLTLNISSQYLLGEGVMVSPVLEKGATTVNAYFPEGSWYNLFDLTHIQSPKDGNSVVLNAPLDTINVHLYQGCILPMQGGGMTTEEARKTPFTLVIAFPADYVELAKKKNEKHSATGNLFLDDGEDLVMEVQRNKSTYVEFHASATSEEVHVSSKVTSGEFALQQGWKIQNIVVLGSSYSSSMTLNVNVISDGVATNVLVDVATESATKSLKIQDLNIQLGKNFKISWTI